MPFGKKEQKITQQQLAEKSGVPQSMISMMETGQRNKLFRLKSLAHIAYALGLELAALTRRAEKIWQERQGQD